MHCQFFAQGGEGVGNEEALFNAKRVHIKSSQPLEGEGNYYPHCTGAGNHTLVSCKMRTWNQIWGPKFSVLLLPCHQVDLPHYREKVANWHFCFHLEGNSLVPLRFHHCYGDWETLGSQDDFSSVQFSSVQFNSVAQSCPTLCDPINCSTPGLPVHHQLPESTQTCVHGVGDAIQPSHPLSSPSPPAPNPSQHQSFFQWVNSSHEVAKVLEFQL